MLSAIIVMVAVTAVPLAALWYFTRKERSRFEATLTPEERERLRGFSLLQSWQEFIPMAQPDCADGKASRARVPSEVLPPQPRPPAPGEDRSFPQPRFFEPSPGVSPAPQEIPVRTDSNRARAPIRADAGREMPASGTDHVEAPRPNLGLVGDTLGADLEDAKDREIAVVATADAGERDSVSDEGADVSYSVDELRSKASFCRWKAAAAGTELEKGQWRQLADHWLQLARSSADDADGQQAN